MKNIQRKHFELKKVKEFIIVFYIIGFLGFIFPLSFRFFVFLIPFALLLSSALVLMYHQSKYDAKTIIVFSFIYVAGLCIEIIGVKTGKVFGAYHYGSSLGPKIFETPLIIGLNWLFLVYASASVVEKFNMPDLFKPFISAALMVAYDIVTEQVAGTLDMWHWENKSIPLQNYLTWFGLAFIFGITLKIFRIKTPNPVAFLLFTSQFLLFLGLFIFFKIIL
jgi:putative membrane protein